MKKILSALIVISLSGSLSFASELTQEQQQSLNELGKQYAQKATHYDGMIQARFNELGAELAREGRLDSEEAAEASAEKANILLQEISDLYQEYIKQQIKFMLDSKNVLTREQREYILNHIDPASIIEIDEVDFLQTSVFDLPLNLTAPQQKKLIQLEADLLIKEIEQDRDIQIMLLELKALFNQETAEPDKVDQLVKNLSERATDTIGIRVDFFIGAKDILTLDQKRLLSYMIGLD